VAGPGTAQPTASDASGGGGFNLKSILSSPIVGFLPWIVMSVISGPGKFELACGLALAIAVVTMIAGYFVGLKPKILDIAAVIFFVALVIIGELVNAEQLRWLDDWAGELSNIMIAVVALFSMLIRQPFTLQYAKEEAPRELWDNPLFIRTNYVITGVWCLAFVVSAVAGWFGDAIIDDPNNIWTGWIIQIAALILAGKFTGWYPDYVQAKATGQYTPPSLANLLIPVTAWFVPAGIIVLVTTDAPWYIGVGLIVIGGMITKGLHASDQADEGAPAARI
jgi:hypothetical protein